MGERREVHDDRESKMAPTATVPSLSEREGEGERERGAELKTIAGVKGSGHPFSRWCTLLTSLAHSPASTQLLLAGAARPGARYLTNNNSLRGHSSAMLLYYWSD